VDCGVYVRQTVEYAVEEAERIKSLLLLPKNTGGTAPAVIAHHQHAGQFDLGKSEVVGLAVDADQAYGAELAECGYVVIAPDALGFEERNWSVSRCGCSRGPVRFQCRFHAVARASAFS
jgi:dienelactone hydrolase